jgi:hypothetical protein
MVIYSHLILVCVTIYEEETLLLGATLPQQADICESMGRKK